MSKYRNKYEIFCDAYGTFVNKSKCNKCPLKRDCTKVKFRSLNNIEFKIHRVLLKFYYHFLNNSTNRINMKKNNVWNVLEVI